MKPADARAVLSAPWLAPTVQRLRDLRAQQRFPPALLLQDPGSGGSELLGRFVAQLVLCKEIDAPCGHCRACESFAHGQNPDFHAVGPREESRFIRVEQVRELIEQVTLTAHGGMVTAALICPADAMLPQAANALLKTLEEPRPGVTIILGTALPGRLPATIRSRCQRLAVPQPTAVQAQAWLTSVRGEAPWAAVLDLVGGSPLAALDLQVAELAAFRAETDRALGEAWAGTLDVAATAERWGRGEGLEWRLACFENWVTSRIDAAAYGEQNICAGRPPTAVLGRLIRVLDAVQELVRLRSSSINRPLALEQLLWQLAAAARPGPAVGRMT